MGGIDERRLNFTLNGQRYELSKAQVQARLANVKPDAIRKHSVRINGLWFPVLQAFESAIGIPRSEFISHTARRHLAALGFEVRGEIDTRQVELSSDIPMRPSQAQRRVPTTRGTDGESWHREENVQASAVSALVNRGWRILSVANTATKEHGVDIIAMKDGWTVGVEVKGFPSRGYADPRRANETKKTSPSTQAGHWFSQAILAAMRLRGREPSWRSVIILPRFPRYVDLYAETRGSLEAAQISVWWIATDGQLSET